jgi:hypothetical protein
MDASVRIVTKSPKVGSPTYILHLSGITERPPKPIIPWDAELVVEQLLLIVRLRVAAAGLVAFRASSSL